MRLVSVYYRDFYPFDTFDIFDSFTFSNDPEELRKGDVIVVWGGNDISPTLYGKAVSQKTWASDSPSQRDQVEWRMMTRAAELGIPIIGVCRGGQMLCALAGGYLIQHMQHPGSHPVKTYDGKQFMTNSLHHQMMVAPENVPHEVLAEIPQGALLSTEYWDEDKKVDHKQEPEFIYFNKVKGFAIQWHPEMMQEQSPANIFLKNELEKRL